jgi:hypothetical protein
MFAVGCVYGTKKIIFLVVEHIIVDGNARRYQFGNAPLDEFFGCFGVFQLIANGNSFACSHQFGQIGIECVMGKSRKLHKLCCAVGTSCERYAQNFGSYDGVIRKSFVKIAYTKQQYGIGMLFFDLDVLLHQRCFYDFFAHCLIF